MLAQGPPSGWSPAGPKGLTQLRDPLPTWLAVGMRPRFPAGWTVFRAASVSPQHGGCCPDRPQERGQGGNPSMPMAQPQKSRVFISAMCLVATQGSPIQCGESTRTGHRPGVGHRPWRVSGVRTEQPRTCRQHGLGAAQEETLFCCHVSSGGPTHAPRCPHPNTSPPCQKALCTP